MSCPAEDGGAVVMVTHAIAAHYYDSRSHFLNSSVYRWHAGQRFMEHQALPTVGAWDLVALEIEGAFYLVVASLFDGSQRKLPSTVHRWDVMAGAFVPHQEIWGVEGAMDVEAFAFAGTSFIVITGHRGAPGAAADCSVLRWAGASFEAFQTLAISGGQDAEAFSTGSAAMLVVVHERVDVYSAGEAALQPGGAGFSLMQTLELSHGRDAAHFWQGHSLFLVLAVFRDDTSYETESRVLAWNAGSERFEEVQGLPSSGGIDVEVIEARGGSFQFVAVASQRSGTTRLYRWSDGFVEAGSLDTPRVYDLSWHRVREDGTNVVGVARFGD